MADHIEPHRVSNANIISPVVDKLFDDGRKASILYCDPPWGDAAMKMFVTLAQKRGERVSLVSFNQLLDRLFDLTKRHVSGTAFIEIGQRWVDEIGDRMVAAGLQNVRSVSLQYGKSIENTLLAGNYDGIDPDIERCRGLSGAKVAQTAIALVAKSGEILFDPTCGAGYSAKAALAHKMEFRGNEFSRSRLEKTIKLLR